MRHGQGFDLVFRDYLGLLARSGGGGHGPVPLAASGFERYTPLYDYRPDELLDDPALGLSQNELLGLLARLSSQMHLAGKRVSGSVGSLPAGYTYLAQFAIHDLVNTAGLRITRSQNLPSQLFANVQTSALDLSSLYGGGPAGSPALFEPTDETEHRTRFRLGYMVGDDGAPSVAEDIPRLPLGPHSGTLSPDGRQDPILADTRNADNLILSQLVVLFMQAHNRFHDLAFARAISGQARHPLLARPFEAARCLLTASYRRILRGDLLPRLLPEVTWKRFFVEGHAPQPDVSLEAALAVLRFGHALVQKDYDFSDRHSTTGAALRADLALLMDFFGMRPGAELPVNDSWVIDWGRFFDMARPAAPPLNRARPLGPALVEPLRDHAAIRLTAPQGVTALDGHVLGLAFRTLAKGLMAHLPTGQSLAARLVADGLVAAAEVPDAAAIAAALRKARPVTCRAGTCLSDDDIALLAQRTPLFAWVLIEAQIKGAGRCLGPVGAHVLADTFAMALADTGFASVPLLEPAAEVLWQELAPGGAAGSGNAVLPATMPELVAFVAETKH